MRGFCAILSKKIFTLIFTHDNRLFGGTRIQFGVGDLGCRIRYIY